MFVFQGVPTKLINAWTHTSAGLEQTDLVGIGGGTEASCLYIQSGMSSKLSSTGRQPIIISI